MVSPLILTKIGWKIAGPNAQRRDICFSTILRISNGELRERVTSSSRPASSAELHHRAGRHRYPDGRGRPLSARLHSDGRQSLSAPAYLARAYGAQVAEAAVRNRGRAGLAGTVYAQPSVLGDRAAA